MKNKWLLILGAVAAIAAALAAGVKIDTLLIVGALLLCPAAMYFGMRGMSHGADEKSCCNLETDAAQGEKKIEERPKAA